MPVPILEPEVRVDWPLQLQIGRSKLFLVDDTDPVLKPIWEGEPTLGWSGDERLRLYFCVGRAAWELVRYEADGQFRIVTRFLEDTQTRATDMVAKLIVWLIGHDSRRGFDPVAAQDAAEAKAEADDDARLGEFISEELAPQLAHGMHKDGVDVPGHKVVG